ncbi:MAG: CheR family methyltransferase [Acidobacteriota bacterium]
MNESRKICQLIKARIGLVVSEDRLDQVKEALQEVIVVSGLHSFDAYYHYISQISPSELCFQALVERVTIGETFFFRDHVQIRALRNVVLPELIDRMKLTGRPINILSAACSTGEEPYSIAILLQELLPGIDRRQCNLIGGDINLNSLSRAIRGRYSKWSFRGVDQKVIDRYFVANTDGYEISHELRSKVKFQYLNLAEELPFNNLDLILLRNVLIYFTRDFIKKVIERCTRALRDDGWLIVGASELNQEYFSHYQQVDVETTSLYRKSTTAQSSLPQRESLPRKSKRVKAAPIASISLSKTVAELTAPVLVQTCQLKEQDSREQIYLAAYESFQNNDLTKAEELLRRLGEEDTRALLLMAKIAANRGQYTNSEQYCRKYIDLVPDNIEGHYLLGLIHQAENRLEAAAQALRYAIFLDTSFIMGHWNLALVYQKLADRQATRRHLNQVKNLLKGAATDLEVVHSDGQTPSRMLQVVEMMLQGV